jgi:hypothetical protein
MNARATLIALFAVTVCAGCNRPVTIAASGHELATALPNSGAVHPYDGLPTVHEPPPLVAIFFSGPMDLEALAESWTHHLYFDLISCADPRSPLELFNGPVFRASSDEQKRFLRNEGVALYKVYVPLDPRRLDSGDNPFEESEMPAYRQTARVGGVCLRIGGGNMSGFGLRSNVVKTPLALGDDGKLAISVSR